MAGGYWRPAGLGFSVSACLAKSGVTHKQTATKQAKPRPNFSRAFISLSLRHYNHVSWQQFNVLLGIFPADRFFVIEGYFRLFAMIGSKHVNAFHPGKLRKSAAA